MNSDEHLSLPAHLGPLSDSTAMPLESLPPLAEPSEALPAGAPVAAPAAPAPAAAPAPVAAGGTLDAGQLGALDSMMQAFLADGVLTAAEQQAYQAARAGFLGEETPHATSPQVPEAAPVEAAEAPPEEPHADDGHTTLREAVAAYQETKVDRRYTLKPLPPAHEVHQDPQMTPTETAHSQVASPADRPLPRVLPVARVGPVDRI